MTLWLVDRETGALDETIEGELVETRRLYAADSFELTSSAEVTAGLKDSAALVSDVTGVVYLVEALHGQGDIATLSGRDVSGEFSARVTVPPDGLSHDRQAGPVETVMKGLVTRATDAEWAVPNLDVAADQGRGPSVKWASRYRRLDTELARVGAKAGFGWQTLYSTTSRRFTFDVVAGRDRRKEAALSRAAGTVGAEEYVSSRADRLTYAIVLGQGEGAARTRVLRWAGKDDGAPSPAGFDRRAVVVDARDIDDVDELAARGDAVLAESARADTYEATIAGLVDVALGDLFTVASRWAAPQDLRAVEVVYRRRAGLPEVTATLGRPFGWTPDTDQPVD